MLSISFMGTGERREERGALLCGKLYIAVVE
jgi:hypothetical protein